MIYCTLLNPAIDLIYSLEGFIPGSTMHNVPCRVVPAGKGINVALIARVLGEDACVVGLLPERDKARFVSYLDCIGIKHLFFPVPGDVRMNVTIIEKNDGAASHIHDAGRELSSRLADEFMRFVSPRFAEGDQWCFTGSLPGGFDNDVYATLVRLCGKARSDAFLDTRGKPLQLAARARPTALKPNISELEDLFGEQIQGVHHIALKGKKLLDMGIPYVFISLGSDGMIALHDNDCMLCSPPHVKTIDTAGCGDALMAGVLVAWKRQFSFSETCRLATACGASKALHEGTSMVTRDEIWQLMEDVRITAV